MKKIVGLLMLICLFVSGSGLAQVDRSEEVHRLSAGIEAKGRAQRIQAAKLISQAGLQDVELYTKIADLLRAQYRQKDPTSSSTAQFGQMDHTDEMSWMCKALAASGDIQYRQLLDEIAQEAPSSKLRRYAEQSSNLLSEYKHRSDVLNATDKWDDQLSAEENRILNMLDSGKLSLIKDAAKMVVRRFGTDDKVFELIAWNLRQMKNDFQTKGEYVDTMAWLCKALAASGDKKYLKDLQSIADNTQSMKLRSYAKKSMLAIE